MRLDVLVSGGGGSSCAYCAHDLAHWARSLVVPNVPVVRVVLHYPKKMQRTMSWVPWCGGRCHVDSSVYQNKLIEEVGLQCRWRLCGFEAGGILGSCNACGNMQMCSHT